MAFKTDGSRKPRSHKGYAAAMAVTISYNLHPFGYEVVVKDDTGALIDCMVMGNHATDPRRTCMPDDPDALSYPALLERGRHAATQYAWRFGAPADCLVHDRDAEADAFAAEGLPLPVVPA